MLFRLVSYISSTLTLCLRGFLGKEVSPHDLALDLYADADFAGDSRTGRSTTGGFGCVFSPEVFWPVAFKTAKQTRVSTSTPEAELVSASGVLKGIGIPLADLFDHILGRPTQLKFYEDNSTCITAIRAGQSPTMRHLKRCHNVSLKWLHDVLTQNSSFTLLPCASSDMIADIFTKPFPDKKLETWNKLCNLLGMRNYSG